MIDLNGIPQVLWPDHCIQNTDGAKFHDKLVTDHVNAIIHKGMDTDVDSYSAFQDNDKKNRTGLTGYLDEKGCTEVYICGLATDYCVKATAIDAAELRVGFPPKPLCKVYVIEDACRGVAPESTANAIKEMKDAGITMIKSSEIK
jgi:nicotinamidase/pyrazinamidase